MIYSREVPDAKYIKYLHSSTINKQSSRGQCFFPNKLFAFCAQPETVYSFQLSAVEFELFRATYESLLTFLQVQTGAANKSNIARCCIEFYHQAVSKLFTSKSAHRNRSKCEPGHTFIEKFLSDLHTNSYLSEREKPKSRQNKTK